MKLEDLKNLANIDFNDPSSWPLAIKLIGIGLICMLLLAGGYWFFIQGELDNYAAQKMEEEKLRETYLNKKAMAINLPAYKQQMEEMEQTFGSLLRQLPNSTEVPDLLVDITQAGLGRGLEFVLFKPEAEQRKDFYAELPISLTVNGSYHELAQFVSDVSVLPRIVTFANINITNAPASRGSSSSSSNTSRLTMTAQARTYRYLEGGGGAAQAKPTRKGAK